MTLPEIRGTFFLLNWLLIIADASVGYFVLPLLLPQETVSEEQGETADASFGRMRHLLSVMVGLYMLVNCYAYFRGETTLLYVVTALLFLDIVVQLVVRHRRGRQG